MAEMDEPSYIDYEAFLDPDFSPPAFANSLVLATNNPSDTPLDLSTPLSRVLFDVQEIDTHIDALITKSALPLLEYTQDNASSSARLLEETESQVASLTESYKRLEREVIERHKAAEEVRITAERLCETVKLGRAVSRCFSLGRQLEAQVSETTGAGSNDSRKGDHKAMIRAAHTLILLRQLLAATGKGEEGEGLNRVHVIQTLQDEIVANAERTILSRAQQIVREFSMSSLLASSQTSTISSTNQPSNSSTTYAQTEDTKSRTISALTTLYLLSPLKPKATTISSSFEPTLLLTALQSYLQTALTSSLAALARALATLPTLDRTLLEIAARCQNIVALESLLASTPAPPHPLLQPPSRPTQSSSSSIKPTSSTIAVSATTAPPKLLAPLLAHLDTAALPSYFWRSLAGALSARVQDILARGGVSARTLRSNRERVREALRECVGRGSQVPEGVGGVGMNVAAGTGKKGGAGAGAGAGWEREAAVMVGAVVGVLGR
ncbi:MAG: hypothetical protein M1822_008818 [Bathelium mastoideum]|nr:MAG: hypothetical protein M1822_008818 [Bathelium mastoideum]